MGTGERIDTKVVFREHKLQLKFATKSANNAHFRYIEIWKRMKRFPVLFDFMLMFTEIGPKGIILSLPLVKACFASLLINLESIPLKTDRISDANLYGSAQLFSLFISVSI